MNGRDNLTLSSLRHAGAGVILAGAWLVTLGLVGVAVLGSDSNGWLVAILGGLCALAPTFVWFMNSDSAVGRILLGCTVPVYPAAVLALMKGSAWQTDIHMMFFAGVAMLVILCDWRAVLAGTLVTAVHHLGLNYLATAYVFNSGGSLERVLLHAAILLVEAGVLMWVSQRLSALFAAIAAETGRATSALQTSEAATEQARSLQEAQSVVVQELTAGLSELAQLRLTHRIERRFAPNYEQLRTDFNSAMDSLQKTVATFRGGTDAILEASAQVVEASQNLAHRTEQQADSLQQTAAQTNQLSTMVETAADGASETDNVFRTVFSEAKAGGDVVREAVAAMGKIEESSHAISSIVTLIEGIAFQTNLLALNAGVEAARAGTAGQGFAVVAHEVRTLAGRASEAASEIKSLIAASTTHVGDGVKLVDRAGSTLDGVVSKLENVRELIAGAADGSRHQASGLRVVRSAVDELDRGTQQNAAMAEQSTAAMRNMSQSLQTLRSEVARFKVA